jgi:hypothetical protein
VDWILIKCDADASCSMTNTVNEINMLVNDPMTKVANRKFVTISMLEMICRKALAALK